jgi:hypothetical protein
MELSEDEKRNNIDDSEEVRLQCYGDLSPVEDCSLWNRFRLYIGLITFEQISALASVYRVLSTKLRARRGVVSLRRWIVACCPS